MSRRAVFSFQVNEQGLYKRTAHNLTHVIGGDTDSVFVSLDRLFPPSEDLNTVCTVADEIASQVNTAFPAYLQAVFNVPKERSTLIHTERESVSHPALFLARKKYVMKVYDQKGHRPLKPKTKYVGVEIKKSDTPIIIQRFLSDLVELLLEQIPYQAVLDFILSFKRTYYTLPIMTIGTPKTLRNLEKYIDVVDVQRSFHGLPQHAKAAIVYNLIREDHHDPIASGSKIRLIYILPPPKMLPVESEIIEHPLEGYDCIAVPDGSRNLPECLKTIAIDYDRMWTGIQKKIDLFLAPVKLDTKGRQQALANELVEF